MDRLAFEQWLLSLVPSEVNIFEGWQCREVFPHDETWGVKLEKDNRMIMKTGNMVIGADGANSMVRRCLKHRVPPNNCYTAVQDRFLFSQGPHSYSTGLENEYTAFFDPDIRDFYGWVIPKRDHLLLGVALPPKHRRSLSVSSLMNKAIDSLRTKGYQFPDASVREGCLLLRSTITDSVLGKNNLWCIGEAASWISPSSAKEFSYAFASAFALAGAIKTHSFPDAILSAYRSKTAFLSANIGIKQLKSSVMYSPFLRKCVMASGILSE